MKHEQMYLFDFLEKSNSRYMEHWKQTEATSMFVRIYCHYSQFNVNPL